MSAHEAVERACGYVTEGYQWVVDIDLEKFFDTVNHDVLMSLVARKVKTSEPAVAVAIQCHVG